MECKPLFTNKKPSSSIFVTLVFRKLGFALDKLGLSRVN